MKAMKARVAAMKTMGATRRKRRYVLQVGSQRLTPSGCAVSLGMAHPAENGRALRLRTSFARKKNLTLSDRADASSSRRSAEDSGFAISFARGQVSPISVLPDAFSGGPAENVGFASSFARGSGVPSSGLSDASAPRRPAEDGGRLGSPPASRAVWVGPAQVFRILRFRNDLRRRVASVSASRVGRSASACGGNANVEVVRAFPTHHAVQAEQR